MAVTASWDNDDKTAILLQYEQPWTLAEFDASQAEVKRLLASVSHPVHMIIDVTNGGRPPQNAIGRFLGTVKVDRSNQTTVVFVGANMFAKTLIQTLQKAMGSRSKHVAMQFADTRDDARSLLRSMATVPYEQ